MISSEIVESEFHLFKVAYIDSNRNIFLPGSSKKKEKELKELLEDMKNVLSQFRTKIPAEILKMLSEISYLFKSKNFVYEKEVRLVVSYSGKNSNIAEINGAPRVFIDLVPLREVLEKIHVGPNVERPNEWAAAFKHLLIKNNHLKPEVFISNLPFK